MCRKRGWAEHRGVHLGRIHAEDLQAAGQQGLAGPAGALPISTHLAPLGIGSCDQRRASSIFSHARLTASGGNSMCIKPPGQREGRAPARCHPTHHWPASINTQSSTQSPGRAGLGQMMAAPQGLRPRAGMPQGLIGRDGRRRDRGLEAMFARLVAISLPGVNPREGPIAGQIPGCPGQRPGIGPAGFSERKAPGPRKHRFQLIFAGQADSFGQLEGEEAGPREGRAELRLPPGEFALQRLLGPHLASDKQELLLG